MKNPFRNLSLKTGHIKRLRISATSVRITIKNLVITLLLFSLISYLWLLFGNIRPARYTNLQITSQHPQAGQTLDYRLYRCRYVGSSVSTQAIVTLVSQSNKNLLPITLANNHGANDPGCSEIIREVGLPDTTPAGWYTIHIIGIYTILPIRNVSVNIKSDPFYVKPAGTSQKIDQLQQQLNTLQQQLDDLRANQTSAAPVTNHITYNPPAKTTSPPATTTPPATTHTSSPPATGSTGGNGNTGGNGSGNGNGNGNGNSGGTTPPPTNPGLIRNILNFLL